MPGFRIGQINRRWLRRFQQAVRPLPRSAAAIAAHAEEIAAAGLKAFKTGVISPRKPIPDNLVERLALASRKDAGA